MYFVERPNTLKEPKLERHLFSVLTCVLIIPFGEQLWVETIQGYWLLSLGNLLRQKRATISLVILPTLETFKVLLAVVIRKSKTSVVNIPMQNHKPKRTPSEMKDQKVNTGIFKPVTRLTVEKIPV